MKQTLMSLKHEACETIKGLFNALGLYQFLNKSRNKLFKRMCMYYVMKKWQLVAWNAVFIRVKAALGLLLLL